MLRRHNLTSITNSAERREIDMRLPESGVKKSDRMTTWICEINGINGCERSENTQLAIEME